jgi:protein arginine kinase activator
VLSGRIQELSDRLEKAVSEEKYEDAAQVRDEIRELEAKLKKAGSAVRSPE